MDKLKNILITLFLCLTISIGYNPLLANALDEEDTGEVEEIQQEETTETEFPEAENPEEEQVEESKEETTETEEPKTEESEEEQEETEEPDENQLKTDEEEPKEPEETSNEEEQTEKVEKQKYTITVNYIDENNQIIEQFISQEMDEDTSYDFTQYTERTIKGYEFVQVTGDELTGILDSNKVINVCYKKIEKKTYSIRINFLEEKTNKVLKSTIVIKNLKEDEEYTVGHYKIDGYTCISKENQTIKIKDKDQIINLYYRKISKPKYTITVNYIDEDNNKIIDSYVSEKIPQETNYNVTEYTNKEIRGYELVKITGDEEIGTLNCNKVINVHYKKVVSVNNVNDVETSDKSRLYMWIGAALIAFAIIILVLRKSKKMK